MRKNGHNMKCAFISVLMNLIYGEGPVHNFFPSKSTFKSVIHLCYPAVIPTPLFILKFWTYSELHVFFSLFSQLPSCCETSCGNSAQVIHVNDRRIRKIFLLSRNVVASTDFTDNPRLLSLEHLIPMMTHTSSQLSPLLLRSQWGACILHSVRVGIWIGLSLLEQSRTVRSRPPPPSPHLVMTVALCQLEE